MKKNPYRKVMQNVRLATFDMENILCRVSFLVYLFRTKGKLCLSQSGKKYMKKVHEIITDFPHMYSIHETCIMQMKHTWHSLLLE